MIRIPNQIRRDIQAALVIALYLFSAVSVIASITALWRATW